MAADDPEIKFTRRAHYAGRQLVPDADGQISTTTTTDSKRLDATTTDSIKRAPPFGRRPVWRLATCGECPMWHKTPSLDGVHGSKSKQG